MVGGWADLIYVKTPFLIESQLTMGTRRPESSWGVTDNEEVKSIVMDHKGGKREVAMVSQLGGWWHLSWRQGDPVGREGEKERE